MVKRLIAKNIILAFICSLPLWGLTNAYFTDTENSTASLVAGSLDFSLKNKDNQPFVSTSFTNLTPGATRDRIMYINKDGTLDFNYQFAVTTMTGDTALCQALNLEAQYKQGTNYATKYNGLLTGLSLPIPLQTNTGSDKWQFIFTLPANADPALQMMDCSFDLVATGWQTNSDGTWGFTDSEKITFNVDSDDWTAPTSQVSALNQYYKQLPVTIPFTATDQFSKVSSVALWYRFGDTGDFSKVGTLTENSQSVAGTFSFNTDSGQGLYQFYTVATDSAGNIESSPVTPDASFIYDSVAPNTQLPFDHALTVTGPDSDQTITADGNTHITFKATDPAGSPASGLDKTYYYIDSGTPVLVTTGVELYFGTLNLPVGSHTLYFYSIDKAGNVEAAHHLHYTYTRPTETVVINEVMWMGSTSGSDDQWIELRNMTGSEIDISQWKIVTTTGSEIYALSNSNNNKIPANGYFLIANHPKTSNQTNINVDPQISNASMDITQNNNKQLVLKNKNNTIIDKTPLGVWPAGSSSPYYQSMERNFVPGDGTYTGSWHTCTDSVCNDGTYWKTPEGSNYGTPGSLNHSVNDPTMPFIPVPVEATIPVSPIVPEPTPQTKNEKIVIYTGGKEESTPSAFKEEKTESL